MVLVDTSVWVSHLRSGNREMERLLTRGEVLCHPFIIGELALGNLKNRTEILSLLQSLPMAIRATHTEVLKFVEKKKLMGKGVGYVDVHLAASSLLTGAPLWTLDKRLRNLMKTLNFAYS